MEAFITGLGLSSSAGLNAWLPLVMLGIAQQTGVINLEGSFPETITSWPALGAFSILLLIEMIVDKVPGVDHANDVISTIIRPAAGTALMYATTTGLDQSFNPEFLAMVSLIAGGGAAGGVHTTKAVTRPAVTISTGGMGNGIVSVFEDIISLVVALFALLLPLIILGFVMSFAALIPWWLWERQRIDSLRRRGVLR